MRDVVINLSRIKVFDNKFVQKLICIEKKLRQNNCSIALCGLNYDILCVLYLIRLDKYFEFYENGNDAFLRENRLVRRRLKVV